LQKIDREICAAKSSFYVAGKILIIKRKPRMGVRGFSFAIYIHYPGLYNSRDTQISLSGAGFDGFGLDRI
jgi:hypothetical protein